MSKLIASVALAALAVTSRGNVTRPPEPVQTNLAGVHPSAGRPQRDWRAQTLSDLKAMAEAINATDINAVYPDPAAWRSRFDAVYAVSRAEAGRVRDEGGYRAVLQAFAAQFRDAHLSVHFTVPEAALSWPGFLARYDNGTYRVTYSRDPGVADGAAIAGCDGEPIERLIATVARLEIITGGAAETTLEEAASRLFVDRGSPLRARPSRCTIDGRMVALYWRPADVATLSPELARLRGKRDGVVDTRLVGDGAWVRLGYFMPRTPAQAAAFHAAIDAAPSLRDRHFIVLDVRGNGGGPYNWFMAYLRGLYGAAYADYYATARLHNVNVVRLTSALSAADEKIDADAKALGQPADPPSEVNEAADDRTEALARGAHLPFWKAAPFSYARTTPPPPNLVHARVYVLTDYACGSACIGFVDEMKLFPGVEQIGVPTYVDSLTGTPISTMLPSGDATVRAPMMTRPGRVRGDNMAQTPSIRFRGDIMDDRAVERWVLDDVITGRARAR